MYHFRARAKLSARLKVVISTHKPPESWSAALDAFHPGMMYEVCNVNPVGPWNSAVAPRA